jgi:uncharacterized membrane protein YgdD (TMEM256/DUF423 family)
MVLPVFVLLVVSMTALALARSQRLAPWLLLIGTPLYGGLWLMGRLRIPWPDLGLWSVFVLNPYLLVSISFVLMIAGWIGMAVQIARRLRGP